MLAATENVSAVPVPDREDLPPCVVGIARDDFGVPVVDRNDVSLQILLKPEGATVWIKQDDQATRRLITVGGYEADGVRVLNGLEPGDVVITEGYQKLYEGCKVSENK